MTMFFQRLRVLWLGFWSNLIGQGEARNHSIVAQGALQTHKGHLRNVRDALTNLIFQKKKLGDQLQALDHELVELRTDVQQAAAQNRDELAINLITRLESAQEEHEFVKTQLRTIEQDIDMARDTEKQLVKEIAQAEQMIGALTSRHQALKVRRQLQQDLQSATRAVSVAGQAKLHQPLADQIHRLEAELESFQTRREGWEKEWQEMRAKRSSDRHHAVLDQIKRGLKQQTTLPTIVVAEPVR
jgi:phage shock protein A